jgi:tetratricopeptide (TPR) repeat protein
MRVADGPAALAATWVMGRAEMERWVEDRAAFPSGTPLNTDDQPYIEFVAPRRNVMRPPEAARSAAAQYAAMGAAGGDVRALLSGAPSGGPAAAALLRDLAGRYVAAIQPQRAGRALEAAVAADPGDARAWETLGALALDRRDYRRAEEAHRALVRVEASNVAAWLRLGAVLARQQKWGEAREAIARARSLDPKAPVDAELLAFLDRQAARPGAPAR